MRCRGIPALAFALFAANPARAGFDLSYDALFTQTFVADTVVSFDDLLPGDVLEPGDPIAPGVAFSAGAGSAASARALVFDVGGGDLVLRSIDLGSPGPPQQSRIAFAFDADVIGVGVAANAPGTDFSNPICSIYEGSLEILAFISVGGTVSSFFGWLGDETSIPLRSVEYEYVGTEPATPFELDDLAILFAPEPDSSQAAAVAGVALALRRRARA